MARILLVDDVKLFRHLEATVLGSYGYETEEASGGEEALQKIKANPPDLALIDINMPKMNGLDFIKSLDSSPYFIITTAYREYAVESFDLDVLDYLLKPVSLHVKILIPLR